MSKEEAGGLGIAKPRGFLRRKVLRPPPLGLLYTAAVAERDGCDTKIMDAEALRYGDKDVVDALARSCPDIVGVLLSLPSLDYDLSLANLIKRQLPGSVVFLFGSVIKTTWQQWVGATDADYLFYGEPEAIMRDFLLAMATRDPEIPGAHKIDAIAQDNMTPKQVSWRLVEDLDALPYPAWHLVPLAAYGHPRDGQRLYIGTSRGCPKSCAMCPYTVYQGRRWRSRSCEGVLRELEYLRDRFGAKRILFQEPNITVNPERLAEILRGMVDRRLFFDIQIQADLEQLDEDILRLCKQAGCGLISTGIESASEACLGEIGQDWRYLEKLEENIAICKRLGIRVLGFFLVGFANDSWNSVNAALALAKRLDINAHFNIMMPYPGTKVREEAATEGRFRASQRYLDFNSGNSLMSTRHLTSNEVSLARKLLEAEFAVHQLRKTGGIRALWTNPKSAPMLWMRLFRAWSSAKAFRIRVLIGRSRAGGGASPSHLPEDGNQGSRPAPLSGPT